MKNLSYQQVIHNLMWITFFIYFFKKALYKYLFMCYNIITVKKNNILKEDTYYDKHRYYIKLYAVK